MIVDLGESWSSPNYEVRDTAGALQAGSTVTGTITLPDGTSIPATIGNPATGIYTVDYLTVQAGQHQVLVSATGGVLGSLVRRWQDEFTAEDARSMVSVDDALGFLRARDAIDEGDDLETLRWLCLVATDAVERACGRTMVRKTLVEKYDGGRDHIRLRKGPVQSITSVTEHGIAILGDGWVLDDRHDRLYRGTTFGSWCWQPGLLNVVVTYVAGYATPPLIARKVCLNGIQKMWQQSQQVSLEYLDEAAGDAAVAAVTTTLSALEMQAWLTLKKARQA